jgi:hypothetical protein
MRAKLSSADPLPLDDPLNHMASVLGPIVSTTRVYKEVTDLQPLLQHTLFGAAAMVTSDVRNFLQIQDFAQSRGWEWAGNVPSLPNRRKTAAKRLADLLIEQVVASGSSALPPAVASPPPSSRNALGPRTSSLTEVPVAFNPAEELPESNSRTSSATTSQHAVTAPPVVNKDSLEKELNTLFGGFSDHVYQVQGTVYWLVEEKLPSALSSDELRQFVDTLRSATVFLTAEGLQPGATMRELLESGSLKVAYQSFGNGSIPMAVGSTMSRVLPQVRKILPLPPQLTLAVATDGSEQLPSRHAVKLGDGGPLLP